MWRSGLRRARIKRAALAFKEGRPSRPFFRREISNSAIAYSGSPTTVNKMPGSNPQMAFPCLDRLEDRSKQYDVGLGPEPSYSNVSSSGYELYTCKDPLVLDYGGVLPEYTIAYETWGQLNSDKSNAILLFTGLSGSSHAKSHPKNDKPGWWEKFIGPGCALDTDKYFVICTNVLGGCYGSTGPMSIDPADKSRYATRFPIISVNDMVRAQYSLITRHLRITGKLHAAVGSSMGGMQSLAYATEYPDHVSRVVSISGCARSHPSSIAMRFAQRQVLMSDPNWKRGFYYGEVPPHVGMKLAREIATVTYRSGPEWEQRFGRDRMDPSKPPALCPDFLIETYLDHQGEKFCLEYDPNSLLYISKAMDLFDLGDAHLARVRATREKVAQDMAAGRGTNADRAASAVAAACPSSVPDQPHQRQPREHIEAQTKEQLAEGMRPMAHLPTLVIGVESDILFPAWQQREIAHVLKANSPDPEQIQYIELSHETSLFGHDTFLLAVDEVGTPIREFLG